MNDNDNNFWIWRHSFHILGAQMINDADIVTSVKIHLYLMFTG